MIEVIEAAAPQVLSATGKTPTIESYLFALGRACIEASGDPRVRPLLFRLLLIGPRTLCELRRDSERQAA